MAATSSSFTLFNCYSNASNEVNSTIRWSCDFALQRGALDFHSQEQRPALRVVNSGLWNREKGAFILKAYNVSVSDDDRVSDESTDPRTDDGGSDGGKGNLPPENGGNEGGGGDDEDEKEFGPIMKFDEVLRETEKVGTHFPSDILEAAKTTGIRKLLLTRYLDLQGSGWPLGILMRHCPMLRNRMLADPAFLFKVGTEIVIDSCCATFAEMQKRGKDFWNEFELYMADLLVGVVADITLVGMLAPYTRIGKQTVSRGFLGRIQHACCELPSSVFEAERPGCSFSVQQRVATYFYKGVLYGTVGFVCGIVGQGIANLIMNAKRYFPCLLL